MIAVTLWNGRITHKPAILDTGIKLVFQKIYASVQKATQYGA